MKIEETAAAIEIPPEPASTTIEDLSNEYLTIYNEVESLDNELKELKRSKEAAAQALYDVMTAEGLDFIKTDRGSFGAKLEESCGITKELEESAFEHLEEIGLGASIKRTIHHATLNRHFRDGQLVITEDNAALFKTWSRKKITIRRAR